MDHHKLDWTQLEVSFGVWYRGQCTGLLRIIPLGCELGEQRHNPDAPRYAAYGIYTQVKIETDGFACTSCDFVHPGCYRDLYNLLDSARAPDPKPLVFWGDEGNIEIRFQKREEGDVLVVGYLPAEGQPIGHLVAQDPLLLRTCIARAAQFEFLIAPDRFADIRVELEALLEYVRGIEEEASR